MTGFKSEYPAGLNRNPQVGVEISNQIRGLMKTFGLIVPRSAGGKFEAHAQALLASNADLARIIRPLLEAWRAVRARAAELGRQLLAAARMNEKCQLLMSVPGVGAVTATSFITAVEDPANFRRSRSVGAWLGLTTRRYCQCRAKLPQKRRSKIPQFGRSGHRGESGIFRWPATRPGNRCDAGRGDVGL